MGGVRSMPDWIGGGTSASMGLIVEVIVEGTGGRIVMIGCKWKDRSTGQGVHERMGR